MDALANGRPIKCLTTVDELSASSRYRGCSRDLRRLRGAGARDHLSVPRATPRGADRSGSGFTSRALDRWAFGCGVDLKLIAAGKSTQNAYIKSFNGSSETSA
jgi:putative transposase